MSEDDLPGDAAWDDKGEDEQIVYEAQKRFDRCVERESKFRANARRDKAFANGDAYNMAQWDDTIVNNRGDRPCLTNNKVRQHNLDICNDQRQHKTQIKITPSGGRATYEAAQVYSACIRRIEAQSKAVDAYSTAGFDQVEVGLGFVRVETRYESEDSFNQDIYIVREPEWWSIYTDPDAKEYDKADMRFAFKFLDMPRDEFRSEYGKEAETSDVPLDNSDNWDGKDHVRVCEYFRRLDKRDHLHLMADGSVMRESDQPDGWKKANKHLIQRSRDVAKSEVEWFKIAGHKIIDRKEWPGKYIPIVPWIGEEYEIDGVLDRRGHTRALIDPQRIYNYASSAAAEFVGLQTKTPYVAAAGAIEGYEEDWFSANNENKAVLIYNDQDETGTRRYERPEREKPPVSAPAYLDLMNTAKQEMMMVSGQYQENFGQQSNAHSGVAINARQREGANATYHYIDNHAKGVRQIGRIVMDMIPRVYDVQRVIKIMALDGTQSDVTVDPRFDEAHAQVVDGPGGPQPINSDQARQMDNDPAQPDPRVIFNPKVGTYDVDVDVGPSYMTQRQEAVAAVTQALQAFPAMGPWVIDVLARNWDFPDASVIADRAKRMVPSAALGGPPPELQQAQEQFKQHAEQMGATAKQQQDEIERLTRERAELMIKLRDRAADNETDDYRAETERMKAVGAIDPASMQIIVRQMVEEMLQTHLTPLLAHHATVQAGENAIGAPPMPPPDMAAQAMPQQASGLA